MAIPSLASPQPSREQARAVAAYLRGSDDFPRGAIDWLAVGRLGGGRAASDDRIRPGSAPMMPLRALTAMETRRAIVTGDRPALHGAPTSFETLGALYFILTGGQYMKDCPNSTSPGGRHQWRFSDGRRRGSREQTCDYCGDRRTLPQQSG